MGTCAYVYQIEIQSLPRLKNEAKFNAENRAGDTSILAQFSKETNYAIAEFPSRNKFPEESIVMRLNSGDCRIQRACCQDPRAFVPSRVLSS